MSFAPSRVSLRPRVARLRESSRTKIRRGEREFSFGISMSPGEWESPFSNSDPINE